MSLVRRAHPDVTNEVAYVALAQSRGRSSEAAAVLHLPRAKDEAAMVAMMLDVTAFIGLARQAAERRRRSRQLEKQRRIIAISGRGAARVLSRRKGTLDGGLLQSPPSQRQQLQEERRSGGGWEGDATDAAGYDGDTAPGRRNTCQQRLRPEQHQQMTSAEVLSKKDRNINTQSSNNNNSSDNGEGRAKQQSRSSDSAPSLLPPIEGPLIEGTPPSPSSLKAVLSTSRSVAVEVPKGLGFTRGAGASEKDENFMQDRCGSKRTRRDLKAMLWARAHRQRQRMAEMAAPGKQHHQLKRQGGVETLDALMERFFCETHTLDRDSDYLDARLRGRHEKPKLTGGTGVHYNGTGDVEHRAGVGTAFGTNGRDSNTGHSLAWRCDGGLDERQQSSSKTSSPMFLASVNSNATAPFMFVSDAREEGGDDAYSISSSVAAASTRSVEEAGRCSRNRGSCRVQSYFTQALG
ncbi:unnamed protein product, partial [Hapterophycus canaliculatus]